MTCGIQRVLPFRVQGLVYVSTAWIMAALLFIRTVIVIVMNLIVSTVVATLVYSCYDCCCWHCKTIMQLLSQLRS